MARSRNKKVTLRPGSGWFDQPHSRGERAQRVEPVFILASASPRRRQLLKKAGYRFKIIPSQVSESHPSHLKSAGLVRFLATKKAKAVARNHPTELVMGADTLVFVGRQVIGKPLNQGDAKRILRILSGQWQRVYTGVALAWNGGLQYKSGAQMTLVKFKKLNEKEIEAAASRHLDKAGAYSIQHKKDRFVEKIRGDYDNVVGLPVRLVRQLLRGCSG